jgi:hypothetical protein
MVGLLPGEKPMWRLFVHSAKACLGDGAPSGSSPVAIALASSESRIRLPGALGLDCFF